MNKFLTCLGLLLLCCTNLFAQYDGKWEMKCNLSYTDSTTPVYPMELQVNLLHLWDVGEEEDYVHFYIYNDIVSSTIDGNKQGAIFYFESYDYIDGYYELNYHMSGYAFSVKPNKIKIKVVIQYIEDYGVGFGTCVLKRKIK